MSSSESISQRPICKWHLLMNLSLVLFMFTSIFIIVFEKVYSKTNLAASWCRWQKPARPPASWCDSVGSTTMNTYVTKRWERKKNQAVHALRGEVELEAWWRRGPGWCERPALPPEAMVMSGSLLLRRVCIYVHGLGCLPGPCLGTCATASRALFVVCAVVRNHVEAVDLCSHWLWSVGRLLLHWCWWWQTYNWERGTWKTFVTTSLPNPQHWVAA